MPDDPRYLSIGEVLGLLLDEFPDISISKIRFLESQGLIAPERTASGYRKFYEEDVERLRAILHGQREQFLPLKVIKERLGTGELVREPLDSSGGTIRMPRPPGSEGAESRHGSGTPSAGIRRPPIAIPAAGQSAPAAPTPDRSATMGSRPASLPVASAGNQGRSSPPDGLTSTTSLDELCRLAGVDVGFLDELEQYGIIVSGRLGGWRTYDSESVRAVIAAGALHRLGIEPRHLRVWRQSVDKELALIEQLVLPLLGQRHHDARGQASELAAEVVKAGTELRAALSDKALRYLIS